MSPHQSFPLLHKVRDKARYWSAVRANCYVVHTQALYSRHVGDRLPSNVGTMKHVSGYGRAKCYATAHSSYLSRSRWPCSRLHGSPPTYRLGLPPDKDGLYPSLLNLPAGRDDPPDKEITYNCMKGSPCDPSGAVVQQSRQEEDRLPHNPTGDSTTLLCTGGFQSIFNHFLSTQNLSGKGTGSGTDARTCKQITVPK
jgi:hypothetical protein